MSSVVAAAADVNVGGAVAVMVGGLVVWLGLALALGFLGRSMLKNKGRSGGAGFCLGFFLGVVGIIVCASLSDQRPHVLGPDGVLRPVVGHIPVGPIGPGSPSAWSTGPDPGSGFVAPPMSLAGSSEVWRARPSVIVALVASALYLVVPVVVQQSSQRFDSWFAWSVVLIAAAGVGTAIAALASGGNEIFVAIAVGCSTGLAVIVCRGVVIDHLNFEPAWLVAHLALVVVAAIPGVMHFAVNARGRVTSLYPFVAIAAVLLLAVLSASEAFDRDVVIGWIAGMALMMLAFLTRGRCGPLTAVAASGALLTYLGDRKVTGDWWAEPTGLELLGVAVVVIAAIAVAAHSLLTMPASGRAAAPPVAMAGRSVGDPWAAPSPGFSKGAVSWAAPSPVARPAWDDQTIQRGAAGAPTRSNPAPAAAPAPLPVQSWSGFGSAPDPSAQAAPAASNPARAMPGDRPLASPVWWLLILWGGVAAVAPWVPFTDSPLASDFWDGFAWIVLAAAAIGAGIAARAGHSSAMAFAGGVLGCWGVACIAVGWMIVDLFRFASAFGGSVDVGAGMVLFIITGVLGLVLLIPSVAAAFRPTTRRAHPLIGLGAAVGVALYAVGLLKPDEFGFGPFDGETSLDVFVVSFVGLPILAALLAMFLRTGAAHALLAGALLLPLAAVVTDAFDGGGATWSPLLTWGAAIGAALATVGLATASERTVRRGPRVIGLPVAGLPVALVGVAAIAAAAIAGSVGSASEDSLDNGSFDVGIDDDAEFVSDQSSGGTLQRGGRVQVDVPYGGSVRLSIQGSGATTTLGATGVGDFDTTLRVLDGDGFEVTFADDTNGWDPAASVYLDSGEWYTVVVTGYADAGGRAEVWAN